ncbi:MAG: GNAT family N-acetyltransferase [Roseiflexaceae bacterium]|nr:GNAT family N-acetyltransferase [Roseiflexaceae bacterium]
MHIETVNAATFEQILPLIAAYQRFYQTEPDDQRNRAHFGQFMNDHSKGIQFVALDDTGSALGFATLYFPLSSTRATVYCLLNDLFTIPESRGQGVGRALIGHSLHYAQGLGFDRISWQTAQTNSTAQQLYDHTGATRGAWYTYTLFAKDYREV